MTSGEEVRRTTPRFVQTTLKGVTQVLINSLKSRRDDERGFTLIELMVVVLIIAILIAIAIPTFLGARKRAQDRAAQSDLRNALTAEKTFYTDFQSYADAGVAADLASLKDIEASLNWGTASSATVVGVGVANIAPPSVTTTVTSGVVCLEKQSKSGATFALADVSAGVKAGTYYSRGTCPSPVTEAGVTAAPFVKTGW
jgi:type IV pilus assembly protein PilA